MGRRTRAPLHFVVLVFKLLTGGVLFSTVLFREHERERARSLGRYRYSHTHFRPEPFVVVVVVVVIVVIAQEISRCCKMVALRSGAISPRAPGWISRGNGILFRSSVVGVAQT